MLNSSPLAHDSSTPITETWVALSIGNTHWKWGYFKGYQLTETWKTTPQPISPSPHDWADSGWSDWCLRSPAFQWHQQQGYEPFPCLRLASVVEDTLAFWQAYPRVETLTLANVPVPKLYPGLGIDRALTLLGAGQQYGWPVLVIDAGTALTFSGADQTGFQGGAIAPGLGLQLSTLHRQAAALPQLLPAAQRPNRWATDTNAAILSGVLLGTLSSIQDFCEDWTQLYPDSTIVLTGGDGATLFELFQQHHQLPPLKPHISKFYYNQHLIFVGMAHCQTQT